MFNNIREFNYKNQKGITFEIFIISENKEYITGIKLNDLPDEDIKLIKERFKNRKPNQDISFGKEGRKKLKKIPGMEERWFRAIRTFKKPKTQAKKDIKEKYDSKITAENYYQETIKLEELELYLSAIETIEKALELDPHNEKYEEKLEELKEKLNKEDAKEYYKESIKLEQEIKYNAAIESIKTALQLDPHNEKYEEKLEELKEKLNKEDAKEYYKESIKLEQEEKYIKAIKYCNKAIELDSKNNTYKIKLEELKNKLLNKSENYYEEAIKLEQEEKYIKAIESIEKALKLNPKNEKYKNKLDDLKTPENYCKEVIKLEKLEQYNEAIKYCEEAIKLDKYNIKYNNKLRELKKLEEIKIVERQKIGKLLYDEAIKLKIDSNYFKAIFYCKKALELDPKNNVYKNKLKELERRTEKQSTLSKEKQEKYKAEVEQYYKDIELKYQIARKEYQKALELENEGQHEEAIKHLNEAIKLDLYNENYYNFKSDCLKELGLYKEAIETIKEVINLDPTNAKYKNKLKELEQKCIEQCYIEAINLEQEEKYNEAIETIKEALKIDSNNIKSKNKLKELEQKQTAKEKYVTIEELEQEEKYNEAIETIKEVINLDPTNAKYKNKLQTLEEKLEEKLIESKILYEKVLRFERQKNYKKAIETIKEAIELDPNNTKYKTKLEELLKKPAEDCYERVESFERQENYVKAIKCCEKAIKLDPDNTKYKNKLDELKNKREIQLKINNR